MPFSFLTGTELCPAWASHVEMVGVNNENHHCACVVETEVAVERQEMRCPGSACRLSQNEPLAGAC